MVFPVKVKLYSLSSGKSLDDCIDLREDIFAVPYDNVFMSMYFARMKSAGYVPTNKTKNISEISGTTKKPYKQKHTGNARQGSTRSAQMRGGGIAFGPRGVKANIKIPKGEAFLAKSMLLSKLLSNGKLFVVREAKFDSLKTSNARKVLSNFSDRNIVIVNDGSVDTNSLLAVRNLDSVKFVSNNMLTANDLFYADAVLVDVNSINSFSGVLSTGNCE